MVPSWKSTCVPLPNLFCVVKLVLCCIIYLLLCVFNTSPLYHLRGSLDYLLTGTGPVNAKLSLNVDHERSKEGRPPRIFREA